jgi:WD40 repeat protein
MQGLGCCRWSCARNASKDTFKTTDINGISSVCFNHDGLRLATGSRDRRFHVWDAVSGTILHSGVLEDHSLEDVMVDFE